LHIGTEKTGTTSIQRHLFGNRQLLFEHGYALLDSLGGFDNRQLARICMRLSRDDVPFQSNQTKSAWRKRRRNRKITKQFEKEMRSLPAAVHTVILSSEFLHSRLIHPDEVTALKKLLTPFFSDIRVLCYLRPQVDLAVSFYTTALKDGYDGNEIDAFIETFCTPENPYYNYDTLLRRYEDAFGPDRIDVALFGKENFHGGDLIPDFYRRIDPTLCETMQTHAKAPGNRNESVSVLGQELLSLLNKHTPRLKDRKYRRLRAMIGRDFAGKGKMPTRATASAAFERFSPSNRAVSERYFPDRGCLFAFDPDRYGTVPDGIPDSERHYFDEMTRLLFTVA